MRLVNTLVFPEPAPATTKSGVPLWTTAALCCGFSPFNSGSSDIEGAVYCASQTMRELARGTKRR